MSCRTGCVAIAVNSAIDSLGNCARRPLHFLLCPPGRREEKYCEWQEGSFLDRGRSLTTPAANCFTPCL
jgi:hypothetical protein